MKKTEQAVLILAFLIGLVATVFILVLMTNPVDAADYIWEPIPAQYTDPWFEKGWTYWAGTGTFHNSIAGCTPNRGKLVHLDTLNGPELLYKNPLWNGEIPRSEIKPYPVKIKVKARLVGPWSADGSSWYRGLSYVEVQWKDKFGQKLYNNRLPVQALTYTQADHCKRYNYTGEWYVPEGAWFFRIALVKAGDPGATVFDAVEPFWTYGEIE